MTAFETIISKASGTCLYHRIWKVAERRPESQALDHILTLRLVFTLGQDCTLIRFQCFISVRGLEDGQGVRWRPNATWNIQRYRCQEERVFLQLGALYRQGLEVPQFADGESEKAEEILVEHYQVSLYDDALPLIRRLTELFSGCILAVNRGRQYFKCNCIPRNSAKVVVPEPCRRLGAPLDASAFLCAQHLILLFATCIAELFGESASHDNYVALLESDAFPRRDLFYGLGRDHVLLERRVLDPLHVSVGFVVDKDTTADHAADLMPVVQRRKCFLCIEVPEILYQVRRFRQHAVVAQGSRLVRKMTQAIPLATALGVERDLVVEAMDHEWGINEGVNCVVEAFAAEARRLDGADGPVKRNTDAFCGFFEGSLDDGGGEEVEAAQVIFLAIFVKNAPRAALGHAFDGREGVEVGEIGVV